MARICFRSFSEALGKAFAAEVVLPEGGKGPFPVLWLLHGAGDDHSGWLRHTCVERVAARRRLAVVAPDAHLSMYEDMAHGGRYFTHIADELPALLCRLLPLSGRREDNFVAGLSMGGMGALKVAMRRPSRYAAVCCLSAGYSNYRFHQPRQGSPRYNRYCLCYGERGAEAVEGETLALARALALSGAPCPRVLHMCGDKDPLLRNAEITREFFASLEGDPFCYRYLVRPGRHNWDFWAACVEDVVDFVLEGRGARE